MKKEQAPLIPLFAKFLKANDRNKRTMLGGRTLSSGTKLNYKLLYDRLVEFESQTGFDLSVTSFSVNNKRVFNQQKRYYEKLYKAFTDYLYKERNQFDNTVGANIKHLKVFYKWLNQEEGVFTGEFYKKFYIWKEEIPIVVLQPEQLNFLINDKDFHESLTPTLQRAKDIFVFGCTVALRVSDLLNIKKTSLEVGESHTYLRTISKKTGTFTKIALPQYAVDIIARNKSRNTRIFRPIGSSNLNKYIKEIAELAGWTEVYPKIRRKRGKPITIYREGKSGKHYRFCDLISTHTMRRTAITTMLNLGVDEGNVRKVSGHSPGSIEFYKYVKYSQKQVDSQLEMMHRKLSKQSP